MQISSPSILVVTLICCDLCSWMVRAGSSLKDGEDLAARLAREKKKGLPKDPLYITDVDLENLFDEWEANDEPLPPDELPPHKRPAPKFEHADDLFKDPEKLMIASKKGKTVMAFVTLAGNPTKRTTEDLTQRWQVGLGNNHMRCERFVIADNRAIFVFEDGSLAFDAKDFFIDQPEVKEYSIDSRVWRGKGYPKEDAKAEEKHDSAKSDSKSKSKPRPVKDEL